MSIAVNFHDPVKAEVVGLDNPDRLAVRITDAQRNDVVFYCDRALAERLVAAFAEPATLEKEPA